MRWMPAKHGLEDWAVNRRRQWRRVAWRRCCKVQGRGLRRMQAMRRRGARGFEDAARRRASAKANWLSRTAHLAVNASDPRDVWTIDAQRGRRLLSDPAFAPLKCAARRSSPAPVDGTARHVLSSCALHLLQISEHTRNAVLRPLSQKHGSTAARLHAADCATGTADAERCMRPMLVLGSLLSDSDRQETDHHAYC